MTTALETSNKKKGWQPPQTNNCLSCERVVFFMEKLEADGKVFHKTCFKCSVCRKTLSAGTYASLEGVLFCKPHFKQQFKTKVRPCLISVLVR